MPGRIFTMGSLLAILLSFTLAHVALAEQLPRPDHVVIVIEENHGFAQIMHRRNHNSYVHALAKRGMLFTDAHGVTHPSLPNYLALFSGSTQDVTDDSCRHSFNSDNLATRLLDAGLGFATYSESLPRTGDLVCASGTYRRKHNPAASWQGTRLDAGLNRRFADFPRDYSRLPTVSFVIPDQVNDMHDGSFGEADRWLKKHIGPYVDWAFRHNSLLILTWDEDDFRAENHVVTILAGPMVKQGISMQRIDHYSVLRTLLDFYGLPALGASRDAKPITGVWKNP
jgi:hypothetical protein